MNRWILLAAALACLPATVEAGIMSRDWKTPGDGLLTYDDVNKREWLDLSQTILSSQFPGADREAKYQYVASQTGAGGLFEGFTIAKAVDVIALAQSAGIDTTTQNFSLNSPAALGLGELLTFTSLPANGNKISVAVLDGLDGNGIRSTATLAIVFSSQAGLSFATPHTEFLHFPGVMLYRAVPEPSSLIFGAVGFFSFMFRKHRQLKNSYSI